MKFAIKKIINKLRIKPTIFVLGFQKCGTTTIYEILSKSKKIKKQLIKENDLLCFERGDYHSFINEFPIKSIFYKKESICGSHLLGYDPEGAKKIKKYFHNVKLVFITRDPIERLISRYDHNKNKLNNYIDRKIPLSLEETIQMELKILDKIDLTNHESLYKINSLFNPYGLLLTKGLYSTFLSTFEKENFDIIVVSLEKYKTDPESVIEKLCDFTDIPKPNITKFIYNKSVSKSKSLISDELTVKLRNFYKKSNILLKDKYNIDYL